MKWVRVISSVWVAANLWGCNFNAGVSVEGGDPGQPGAPDAGAQGAPDAAPRPDAEPQPTAGQIDVPTAITRPTLDADGSDWAGVPTTTFTMLTAMHQADMNPSYGFDAAVSFAIQHDPENIYFYIEVTDDVLVNDSQLIFHDDSIHLYFDVGNDMSGPYSSDDHWLVISSDAVYDDLGLGSVELSGVVESSDTGYVIEAAIPKSDLGMAPQQGVLGFNIGVSDDDGMGGPDRDAFGLWFLPSGPRCTSCCESSEGAQPWCDTTMFGSLLLQP